MLGIKITRSKPGSAPEYCRGFHDKHGQWNNGFYCPKWAGPDQSYCCGPANERVCCPEPSIDVTDTLAKLGKDHLTLPTSYMIAIVCGLVVVVALSLLAVCCLCRCCVLYKRRKRTSTQGANMRNRSENRALASLVNYAACPGQSPPYSEVGAYPLDDPPPYPGHEMTYTAEDKQQPGPSGYIQGQGQRNGVNQSRLAGSGVGDNNNVISGAHLAPSGNHRDENCMSSSQRNQIRTRVIVEPQVNRTSSRSRSSEQQNAHSSDSNIQTVAGPETLEDATGGALEPCSSNQRNVVNTNAHNYIVIANGKGHYSVEV